jgi:serine/threonine protein kinase
MADIEDSGLLSNPARPTGSARDAAEQRWGTMIAERYRVEELLSFDEMGALYRARDTERAMPCALRILPEIYARDPAIRDRFLRDAEAAQVLRHENIVEVFETGKLEDGGVFSVMELLDGQNLKQIVEEEGRMSPGRAVHIASQVCRALGTAHETGIVHRDLKPSNVVLVTQDGELDVVKVLDFGICSHVDSEASAQNPVDRLIGSPDYMAPEQAAGEEAKPESDIYALGTMLFEMLTGKLPYTGRNAFDLLMKKGSQEAPRVDSLVREVPAPLADLVALCLAPRPETRIQSMRILEVELLRSLDPKAPRLIKQPTVSVPAVPADMAVRPDASTSSGVLTAQPPEPAASMSSGALTASASISGPRVVEARPVEARPVEARPVEARVVEQEPPTRDGSNAWLWIVGAGTVAVVLVLFGPTMFGGTTPPPPPEPTPEVKQPEPDKKALATETKLEPFKDVKKLAEPKPVENAVDALVVAGRAEVALTEGRFCEPAGESLRDYLAALKQLDPTHEAIDRLTKKLPEAALATGKKQLAESHFYEAGQAFRCILALAPETKGVTDLLAQAMIGEGKIMRAMKAWDELVPLLEEYGKLGVKPSFDALVLQGQAMAGVTRWQEAVDAYTAALKLKKDKDVGKALDAAKKALKAAGGADGAKKK